jgi:hypothetical protein
LKSNDPLPPHLREWLRDPDRARREHRNSLKVELREVFLLLLACFFGIPLVFWIIIYSLMNKDR